MNSRFSFTGRRQPQQCILGGFYHYTTTTNQTKEARHLWTWDTIFGLWTAVTSLQIRTHDGLPDYIEDANGNGLTDTTEISYSIADTDYDRFERTTRKSQTVPIPSIPNSVTNTFLGYWRFNSPSFRGDQGQQPILCNNVQKCRVGV